MGVQTSTSWKEGQSGNPSGGRKDGQPRRKPAPYKRRVDVKALAREYGHEAINTLRLIMQNKKYPPATRVSAATALLDRGYGKPLQTIDMTAILGAFDLTRLSDEQLEQWQELVSEAAGPTVDKHSLPAMIEGELSKPVEMDDAPDPPDGQSLVDTRAGEEDCVPGNGPPDSASEGIES